MAAFIIFIAAFIGFITFVIVRLSISFIFWCAKNPKDKRRIFKLYFPYYIIVLSALSMYTLMLLNFDETAIAYFVVVYCMALLIWAHEIKSSQKTTFAVEPNQTQLP